jgi:hypothetical protein
MTNWPESFYELLHAYRGRQGKPVKSGLLADLAYLYTPCLEKRWQHPAFQFIQDVFNQYLVDHYARTHTLCGTNRYRSIADRFPYMSVFEAAVFLETSFHFVLQLIDTDQLIGYPPQDPDYLPHPFVNRTELWAWYGQHRLSSIASTAQQLGLSPQVITDLARMGLLEAEDNPQVRQPYRGRIRKKSIAQFLNQISRRLLFPRTRLIDLTTAAQMVTGVDLNEAHLLQAVIQEQLRCFGFGFVPLELKKLRFAELELKDLVMKTATPNPCRFDRSEDGKLD